MATAMNSAKRKVTQDDLRRIMSEQKRKLLDSVKKIDSPLAKYNDEGQLTCILCDSVVRSEAVWNVHINSKQHRENVTQVKKKREAERERERLALQATTMKRKASTLLPQPVKKVKGILKNTNASHPPTSNAVPADFFDGIPKSDAVKGSLSNGVPAPTKVSLVEGVPSDEEDDEDNNDGGEKDAKEDGKDSNSNKTILISQEEVLPEGFFDDPLLDAKARNVEYKDPIEEEWERFQREIKATENMSAAIIAEDQEAATAERQIDEIDEQIRNWSRVLDLERKKELVAQQSSSGDKGGAGSDEELSDSAEDAEPDFDEYLDWRAKKAFK